MIATKIKKLILRWLKVLYPRFTMGWRRRLPHIRKRRIFELAPYGLLHETDIHTWGNEAWLVQIHHLLTHFVFSAYNIVFFWGRAIFSKFNFNEFWCKIWTQPNSGKNLKFHDIERFEMTLIIKTKKKITSDRNCGTND